MTEPTCCVVPQPKRITARAGCFSLSESTCLVLPAAASDEDVAAARCLQQEISEATGLRLPLVKVARLDHTADAIMLVSDWAAAGAALGEHMPDAGDLPTKGDQAYCVDIGEDGIVAGGYGAAALHYAVQTLRQLVRTERVALPCLQLVDWPSLPYRGLMLDVSRGKVPTLETLQELVDQLSLFKANVLQLYTEHTFRLRRHPDISEGCDPLTPEDVSELDDYCRQHFIDLQANFQSFGHQAHMLALPQYNHLAEVPEKP